MKPTSFLLIMNLRLLLLVTGLFLMTGQVNAGLEEIVGGREVSHLNSEEVAVLTRFEVKKGHLHKIKKMISKYVKQANKKDDNIMAEAFFEEDSTSVLWVIERWSNRDAFEKSRTGKKFRLIQSLSSSKLVQTPSSVYIKDLEPISKEQWRKRPGKDDQPITIMLFVDSKPGTEATFQHVYHTAMPQFRSEPGVVNYQLSQLNSDQTQFVTYEKFRNEDAFQYHLKFPPIQPVIDYLNTSIKKQPFQLGLHRLVQFAPYK